MKVLIISALPYDVSSTTRAFKTYFYNQDKNNLAQIFTNSRPPNMRFCSNFFQITDKEMIKCFFKKTKSVQGTIYDFETFTTCESKTSKKLVNSSFLKKDIGIIHLIRNLVWNEKKWFTPQLKKWIEDFNPDCVFYHNSNSVFISKIAYKISKYFNLPLVLEISDDYYFSKKIKPLIFESIYRHHYKKMLRLLIKECKGCIFISEKMKNKYSRFNVKNSDFVCISSEINSYSNDNDYCKNTFCYFGNTGLNRYRTIIRFAKKMRSLDPNFVIDIYGPILGNSASKKLEKHNFVNLCGSLEYDDLIKKIKKYEYAVIAEPFDRATSRYIEYSLSTKVADSLALGKKIIFIGDKRCGTIDYLYNKKCGFGIITKKDLKLLTKEKLTNHDWDISILNAKRFYDLDFNIKENHKKTQVILNNAIKNKE